MDILFRSAAQALGPLLPVFFALAAGSTALVRAHRNRGAAPPAHPRPLSSWTGGVLLTLVILDIVITATRSIRNGVAGPMSLAPDALMLWMPSLLAVGLPAAVVACVVAGVVDRLAGFRVERSAATAALPFAAAWAVSATLGVLSAANAESWTAWALFVALAGLPVSGMVPLLQARILLRFLVWTSLALAELSPSWAFAPYAVAPGGWRVGMPRLQGLMEHPNPMGWLAAMAIPLEWTLARSKVSKIAFVVPPVVCLILSGSRTVLFAVVLGSAFCMGPGIRQATLWTRRAVMTVAGTALTFAMVEQSTLRDGGTLDGRTEYWGQAFQKWYANPVMGTGPEAVSNGHNQFLHTAAELGTVGLLAIAWFTVRALRNAHGSPVGRRYSFPALIVLVVIFSTEAPMRFTTITFLSVAIPPLLLMLAAQSIEYKPAARTPNPPRRASRFVRPQEVPIPSSHAV